jgi:hypothetical protein
MDVRTLSTLATIAMISGCGTINLWNHPTHDQAQFMQDRYDCIKDGEQHAAGLSPTGNHMIVADRADECMRVQGYTVTKARRMTGAPIEALKLAKPDEI